jgi:hypothetical protein
VVKIPGYYSTDEATYYVTPGGAVFLVGSIDTDRAVWEPLDRLPADAEPSDFDPVFAVEVERSRVERGIG